MPRHDYTPATYSSGITDKHLGKCMNALNPRKRAVVDFLLTTGTNNWTEACRAAGYEDGPGLHVTAHRMRRDNRINEAMVEEGRRRLAHDLPMAISAVRDIASNPHHKDQLRAAMHIQAQVGLGAVSKVEHVHTLDGDLMDRARAAAARLGIDFANLKNITPEPALTPEASRALPAPDAEEDETPTDWVAE